MRPEDEPRDRATHEAVVRHVLDGQDGEKGSVQQKVDHDDEAKAPEHGLRYGPAGVGDLAAAVEHGEVAVVGEDHALHGDAERQQECPAGWDRGLGNRRRLGVRHGEGRSHQHQEGDRLHEAGDLLGPCARPHSQPLEEREDAKQRQADERSVSCEWREEHAEILTGQQEQGRRTDAPVDPVGIANEEARAFAECAPGVDVEAAGVGQHGAEFREDVGTEQGAGGSQEPRQQVEERVRQRRGHVARRGQDPAADRCADGDGQPKETAEGPAE